MDQPSTWYEWRFRVQKHDGEIDDTYVVRTPVPNVVIGTPAEDQVRDNIRQMMQSNPPGKAWYLIEKRAMAPDEVASMMEHAGL